MYFYTGKTGYVKSRNHKEIQFALLFLNSRNLLKENLTLVFLAPNLSVNFCPHSPDVVFTHEFTRTLNEAVSCFS